MDVRAQVGQAPGGRQGHALEGVEQQDHRAQLLAHGAGDVGRADVAAALLADIDAAPKADQIAGRDRAAQVGRQHQRARESGQRRVARSWPLLGGDQAGAPGGSARHNRRNGSTPRCAEARPAGDARKARP